MAFDEVSFPLDIAYGSTGGPTRKTNILTLDSGAEFRNSPWGGSRHKFNVGVGVKTYDQLHTLKTFWEAREGALRGFRYKDWSDYKSCAPQQTTSHLDQDIGVGTGALTTFQLKKTYSSGGRSYIRTIYKPIAGTVKVALNGVNQTSGWTVSTTTGVISFSSPPGAAVVVQAGFEFEVPCRFDADELQIDLTAFEHGMSPDIMVLEVREVT